MPFASPKRFGTVVSGDTLRYAKGNAVETIYASLPFDFVALGFDTCTCMQVQVYKRKNTLYSTTRRYFAQEGVNKESEIGFRLVPAIGLFYPRHG